MRNLIFRVLQAVVILAVASSFSHADNFMYFKKKAAGGSTTYSDTFTDTNGTALATHNAQWTAASGSATINYATIQSNSVFIAAYRIIEAYYAASSSRISQADVLANLPNNAHGVVINATGAAQGYRCALGTQTAGNYTTLLLSKNGTYANQAVVVYAVNVSHTIRLVATGTYTVHISC